MYNISRIEAYALGSDLPSFKEKAIVVSAHACPEKVMQSLDVLGTENNVLRKENGQLRTEVRALKKEIALLKKGENLSK